MKPIYRKKRPLRVFEAFAGYGSQAMALQRLKEAFPPFDYRVVGISEIDKYAITAYMAVHGYTTNYGDISKIDWAVVPDFDLLTYSFPCGLKGTRVLTDSGYRDISEVQVSDNVLTFRNRFCKVQKNMTRVADGYYLIRAIGAKLKLTAEHPLWVLRDGKQQWVKVKDLKKTDRLSYCIPQGDNDCGLTKEWLWILGRYVADGWCNPKHYHSVSFAIGKDKQQEFLRCSPKELICKSKRYDKTAFEYRIADESLRTLCEEFGHGATKKHIPMWLYSCKKEQVAAFLHGYFAGDGFLRFRGKTPVQMFCTVSKDLFLGIQMLLLKVHKKVCSLSIRVDNRKPTFNDVYNGQLAFVESKLQQLMGDKVFVRIQGIDYIDEAVPVYNLSVEEDESYTCDNVNTHNCTDISAAGQQRGLSEGSGTRSGLLWECRKAIAEKRPRFLLMENVKALTQKKFMPDFLKWQRELEAFGYTNFWQVINAKDYGIPQNRERVFMVSILDENTTFHFPKKMPLTLCLADMLEPNVDEKYYLKDEKAQQLLDQMQKDNTV